MTAVIFLVTLGSIMIYSALKGISIPDVFRGVTGDTLDPHGGKMGGGDFTNANPGGNDLPSGTGGSSTPKAIIDNIVIPMAQSHGVHVTPESVAAANARHGPTISGGRSDHQGPPSIAWAADMSNGTRPTPEMDALARDLADHFGIPWSGSGLVSKTDGPWRYQLIYRTLQGGNHYNHVHFGIKRVG